MVHLRGAHREPSDCLLILLVALEPPADPLPQLAVLDKLVRAQELDRRRHNRAGNADDSLG
jgi:hypothetical protein